MSTDATSSPPKYATCLPRLSLVDRRILRLSFGVTTAMAIGYAIEWPLSFVGGIFVWTILKAPVPGWGWRDALAFIFSAFKGLLCGFVVGTLFGETPIFMLAIVFLILFLTYYALAGGADTYDILFMLVGNTVVPLFAITSGELANFFAIYLFQACAFAALVALIFYGLFPEPPPEENETPVAEVPSQEDRVFYATTAMMVMIPLLLLFFTFQWTGWFLTVAFAAIISLETSEEGALKFGGQFVIGLLIGGVAAMLMYYILYSVPIYPMVVLLFLLSSLIFARQYLGHYAMGKYFAAGYSTIIIIVSTATLPSQTADGEMLLVGRMLRITLAAVWVIGGMTLIQRIRNARLEAKEASA